MTIKCMSIHISNACNLKCSFCYIDKTLYSDIFDITERLPLVCEKLKIKQVAIGGGEPLIWEDFIYKITTAFYLSNIIVNITTNGKTISQDYPLKLISRYVNLISISIDKYKLSRIPLEYQIKNGKKVKKNNILLGYNLLLDDYIQKNLYKIIDKLLPIADYIYLLQMKKYKEKYSLDRKKILLLSFLFPEKILVDESIKLSLGYSNYCGRGREIVSIHPDRSVRPCSFSNSIGYFKEVEDIYNIIKKKYPMRKTKKCLFL